MVPDLQEPEAGGQYGGHPGGGGDAIFCLFQCGEALLEGAYGGVGESGIYISRLFLGEARSCLFGGLEDVAGSGEYGVAVFTLGGAYLTRARGAGGEGILVEVVRKGRGCHGVFPVGLWSY